MNADSPMDKRALRRAMRALRDAIPEQERACASKRICERAASLVAPGATVLVYAAFRSEVDTQALIGALWQKGCRVCLPLVGEDGQMEAAQIWPGEALARDRYGIPTPDPAHVLPPEALDVIFAPGLAFDARGGRLGYGAGYYDRYLARTRCPRYGLAFSAQIVGDVCASTWDEPVDDVITERPQG